MLGSPRSSGLPGAPTFPGTVPLPNVLAAIDQVAPNAKVFVTGYPTVFGSRRSDGFGCQVSQQADLSDRGRRQLDHRQGQGAERHDPQQRARARKAGVDVHYVNVSKKFKSHNLCDRGEPWVNPILFTPTNPPQLSTASFHPTVRGQLAFAGAVNRAAGSIPAGSTPAAADRRGQSPRVDARGASETGAHESVVALS